MFFVSSPHGIVRTNRGRERGCTLLFRWIRPFLFPIFETDFPLRSEERLARLVEGFRLAGMPE
jgi:hypothetical protein